MNEYWSVRPDELAVAMNLKNEEEATQFMVKAVDFNEEARTPMPDVVSPTELQKFGIPAERHEAYEKMWNSMIYFGVVANTWVWLCM